MTKKILLVFVFILVLSEGYSQSDQFWANHKESGKKLMTDKGVARLSFPKEFKLFDLNVTSLRQTLFSTQNNTVLNKKVIISLPNVNGDFEEFEVYEASNFEPDLQARFPQIRAYSGKGITDKYATLKLSISPQGIQTMVFRADKENEFIEPYSQDHTVYAVFKSQRERGKLQWTCSTPDEKFAESLNSQLYNTNKSSAGELKTMRLAQSCNGEYANYFGATSAAQVDLVLAAFNATLTRCNGVYEKDLALHLNLVASSTNVIYYNPTGDPYSTNLSSWNTTLQNTLSSKLTGTPSTLAANNAAYDIGHMFGASGGGGNAGCIGCVCVDDTSSTTDKKKGAGITSPADGIPQGDNFDIDYVAHEVGHQLGGNHTFSMNNEGSGVNMEVGSGVTVMGYAGITSQDIAAHSIDIFHAVSIAQIQSNLATKTCPVTQQLTTNVAPVANAGADYSIPKSTPFALIGSATDANATDMLTYVWEQYDDGTGQTGSNSVASVGKTVGPNWRDWSQSTDPIRYMPTLATILANQQTTAATGNDAINVEALSAVARTLNFRLTVRDNAPYINTPTEYNIGQTNFDNMVVTVVNSPSSFTVTSQNSTGGIVYEGLTSQSVTWNVAGTNIPPINTAYVKILLSTDGGLTFPIVLAEFAENDGEETITIPNNIDSSNCRIKVEARENIYFNVNTINFTITPSLSNQSFNLKDFALYPNPNNGDFTVQFNSVSNNDIQIVIYDMRGRTIMSNTYINTGLFSKNIQLDTIQSGIYLVTVKDGDQKVVKRIVVD